MSEVIKQDLKTEALKLALEALNRGETKLRYEAIDAIKEALADQSAQLSKPWVGLTLGDMYEIGEFKNTHGYVPTGFKRLVETIEAKLKERNT